MLLCVGPTGSGKTTTLHSLLGYINTPERKIWTAEDPVEITQPGLRQVQVNAAHRLDLCQGAARLPARRSRRHHGRRDPRQGNRAGRHRGLAHRPPGAEHAAHQQRPETVTRLLDMGMDPFNFADALLGVLAQRLVRRLCPSCVSARDAQPDEVDELLADYMQAFQGAGAAPGADQVLADWRQRFGREGRLQHHEAKGCPACDGSGLRGRAGVHELMHMTPRLRKLIQTGGRAEEIQHAALAEGLRTLRQDGIEKVLAGVTSIGEVRATTNA
jgi:type II secretory ATPase GspE/PulE/Tfp pilus assembly ATPase PilB-like protein